MTELNLHSLRAQPRRKKKRLGRGDGSGRGKTSGRGEKGQRARSGGRKGLQAKALKSLFLRVPKQGGFQSIHPKAAIMNVGDLARKFPAGSVITPQTLRKKHLVPARQPVKILSMGTITHALTVRGCLVSAEAEKKIIAAGGTVVKLSK